MSGARPAATRVRMAKGADASRSDDLARSFGERLAGLRDAAGLDAKQLADAAGMSPAYVWRLENGRTQPNLNTLARLAIALSCDLTDVVTDLDIGSVTLENRPYRRGKVDQG